MSETRLGCVGWMPEVPKEVPQAELLVKGMELRPDLWDQGRPVELSSTSLFFCRESSVQPLIPLAPVTLLENLLNYRLCFASQWIQWSGPVFHKRLESQLPRVLQHSLVSSLINHQSPMQCGPMFPEQIAMARCACRVPECLFLSHSVNLLSACRLEGQVRLGSD